jgi:hypothetical protein
VLDGKKGRRLCYDSKQLRNARRRAFEVTSQFQQGYRFRAGVEAVISQFDRRTGVKPLRVRGFKNVAFCATLKAAEINLIRATAFSNRKNSGIPDPIRPFGLFYTLYTPAEGRSTSSEAGSPLFWSKSGF